MERGWFKVWRKIIDSRVFANERLLKVWIWCLARANYQKGWVRVRIGRGETEIEIQRGQFLYGRQAASNELDMKPSTVRNCMEKLKKAGNLDIQTDRHFSIVTICNYESYAAQDEADGQPKGPPEDNRRTTVGQPQDTEKKDKKEKKRDSVRFFRPTLEEVAAYCQERKNGIDPQAFLDHYDSNGWKVGGKAPMKDWRAAVRTWEKRKAESLFDVTPPEREYLK